VHTQRHPQDTFPGSCPFHGDCLEGLASGPAIGARTGRSSKDLGPDHDLTVEIEAWYLAQLVSTVVYVLSPQRIVMGGGVMKIAGLRAAVCAKTIERLGGALDGTGLPDTMDRYLPAPALGDLSGVLGAIALAEGVASRAPRSRV